ncbi:MAG: carboxypeptidase-like regulatory domain-containing protein [Bacteroidota bacterium]|nr:carboxypeptidase-like regulatory domain-containing protein [Candidatus Kapabacteria bacterium]MDW8219801.1 carboxypeptidase-like regulatory domain-containing protein [Bacteroidota bacterium]
MTYSKACYLLAIVLISVATAFAQHVQTSVLTGTVQDAENKESLVGATVSIKSLKIGAVSNKSGFFVLKNIPSGKHQVTVSYLGFAKKELIIDFAPGETKKLTIELSKQISRAAEVTVSAERGEADKRQIAVSQVNIPIEQISQIRIGGEADVFRAIQFLPGVLSSSQISSGLFVRGGSPDQNLVLVDGAAVYNPSHLFGFYSTFNTDAIKDVELIKGGFGAQYGTRLSSVINITQKDGNREKYEGVASLGLIASRASVQGPIGNGSFFIGGRRTYLELVRAVVPVDALTGGIPVPNFWFYDVNAKITQYIDQDDKISASVFLSSDDLAFQSTGLDINIGIANQAASLRWTHIFDEHLFATTVVSSSAYQNGFDGSNSGFVFGVENTIRDVTGRTDIEWYANNELTINFGAEVSTFRFGYKQNFTGRDTTRRLPGATDAITDFALNDWTYAGYVQANYQFASFFSGQVGLRGYYLQANGSVLWDPRISVRWETSPELTIKASWGIFHQYLRLASNPDFTFFDTWLPTDASLGPSSSTHYILSLETKPVLFGLDDLDVNFDVYYKTLININELNTFALRSRRASEIFFSGNGEAYGGEIFLQKKSGRLTGWVGYALGWITARFDSINFGNLFFPRYDRRHDFKIVAQYELNEQWELGASFIFQSGQPFTGVSSRFQTAFPGERIGTGITVPTARNGLRLPPSHQLNLTGNYKFTLMGLRARLLIDIFNVYSRQDIWFRFYDTTKPVVEVTDVRLLPILPTVSLEVKFQ